jgi:hypothetical protein
VLGIADILAYIAETPGTVRTCDFQLTERVSYIYRVGAEIEKLANELHCHDVSSGRE